MVTVTLPWTVSCACLSPCIAGWHPKRFEFEPEWDNDAEVSIAEIEFKETDTPEEEAAKLRLLEVYNKRLDEVRLDLRLWSIVWLRVLMDLLSSSRECRCKVGGGHMCCTKHSDAAARGVQQATR
jgi:hypothetical protein